MKKILFIRHGETKWNKEDRVQGISDISLSKKGKEQAKAVSSVLKDIKLDAIYTSPLKRTVETANAINKFHKLKVMKLSQLKEINYGIFEGMTKSEIINYYSKKNRTEQLLEAARGLFDENFKFPEGEGYTDLSERIELFLKHLFMTDYETIAVVTHASVILNLAKKVNKWNRAVMVYKMIKSEIDNCSFTIFEGKSSDKLKMISLDKFGLPLFYFKTKVL